MNVRDLARRGLNLVGEARKALTALAGGVAVLTEYGVLHGTAQEYAAVGTVALTTVLTWIADNGPLVRELDKLAEVGPGFIDEPESTGKHAAPEGEPEEPTEPSMPALDPAPVA